MPRRGVRGRWHDVRMTRYWLGVVQRAHVRLGVEWGIAQTNHGKRAGVQRMQPGDGFVYYSPKTSFPEGDPLREFTAIGRVGDGDVYRAEADPEHMAGFRPWRRTVIYSAHARSAPIGPLIRARRPSRFFAVEMPGAIARASSPPSSSLSPA